MVKEPEKGYHKWKVVSVNAARIFQEGFAKELLSFAASVEGPVDGVSPI